MIDVLFAGESWVTHKIHIKGFDCFTESSYEEGREWLQAALEENGMTVDYIPNHKASRDFPTTMEELDKYDAVILSDIGSNTLLLHPDTFENMERTPNRLKLLRDYVEEGNGVVMFGGYMSYQGINGKAQYKNTPMEEILPVEMLTGDDRVEVPEGFKAEIENPDHPILDGIPREWPHFLTYNKLNPKEEATVLASHQGDPVISAWEYGEGRTVASAVDCAPHGAPPSFLKWEHTPDLWSQMIEWVAGER